MVYHIVYMRKIPEKSSETIVPVKEKDTLQQFLEEIDRKVAILEEVQGIKILLSEKAQKLKQLHNELTAPENQDKFQDSFRSHDLVDQIDALINTIEELNEKWRKLIFEMEMKEAKEEDRKKRLIN